jgi:hypothetical protein
MQGECECYFKRALVAMMPGVPTNRNPLGFDCSVCTSKIQNPECVTPGA